MMQLCASAAKLLGGGPILLFGMVAKPSGGLPSPRIISSEPLSHGVCRSRCRVVGCVVPDGHCAGRKTTPRRRRPSATMLSATCAPRRRSSPCGSLDDYREPATGTIQSTHCSFDAATSARPAGSCHGAPAHFPLWPIPFPVVACRFRPGNRSAQHSAPPPGGRAKVATAPHAPTYLRSRCQRPSPWPATEPWDGFPVRGRLPAFGHGLSRSP